MGRNKKDARAYDSGRADVQSGDLRISAAIAALESVFVDGSASAPSVVGMSTGEPPAWVPTIATGDPVVTLSKAASRYKVLTTKLFSLHGQIVTVHAGDVVGEDGYGAAGIARMIDAGVSLEIIQPA